MNFKLFAHCNACGKRKFFVKRRTIRLPMGITARAKDDNLICTQCAAKLQTAIDDGVMK